MFFFVFLFVFPKSSSLNVCLLTLLCLVRVWKTSWFDSRFHLKVKCLLPHRGADAQLLVKFPCCIPSRISVFCPHKYSCRCPEFHSKWTNAWILAQIIHFLFPQTHLQMIQIFVTNTHLHGCRLPDFPLKISSFFFSHHKHDWKLYWSLLKNIVSYKWNQTRTGTVVTGLPTSSPLTPSPPPPPLDMKLRPWTCKVKVMRHISSL